MMHKHHADYTNTFRSLTFDTSDTALSGTEEFIKWCRLWQARLERQQESKGSSRQLMQGSNPAVIPRNHRVEEALEAAEHGDCSVMERLLNVLSCPFAHSPEQVEYSGLPELSGRHTGPFAALDKGKQFHCGLKHKHPAI
jgi:uncharacterized protein YdiU (UPF0061 family)